MSDLTEHDGVISFDVTVQNTGSTAGKNVVEVYVNPPYTNGGIEKASVNLAAFGKSELLQPGQSGTVHIELKLEDIASYDSEGEGGYILEAGDYVFSINSDFHTELDSKTYALNSAIVYNSTNPRSSDKTAAMNQFNNAGYVTYLSRANHFANYDEATASPATHTMPEDQKAAFINNFNYDPTIYNDPNDVMPQQGISGNWVFKSNAQFAQAVPKYIMLAVVLVILSAALPANSQALFINIGVPAGVAPTLANIVNILMQVVISCPAMKFWVMPGKK